MQDERILSAQERALLSSLLHHAKTAAGENAETQATVRAVIAAAVGETVAQRAFAVLGARVVERILEVSPLAGTDAAATRIPEIYLQPNPPAPGQPEPPAPHAPVRQPLTQPDPPAKPLTDPQAPGKKPSEPQHPGKSPGQPQGPGKSTHATAVSEASVAVVERPAVLPARCVVLDEFLAPQELEQLTRYTLEHEADFRSSEVVSPAAEGGVINYEHRRSRVLMDLAEHEGLILERIKAVLPQVLEKLGMEESSTAGSEVQITASNNGDFFLFHSDNGSERVAYRHLTFVYFFHREPRQFEGGELRIHDARLEGDRYVSEGSYHTIVPQQNQIVLFPCELLHEITPVKCPSQLFADSRFTVNGWLRR